MRPLTEFSSLDQVRPEIKLSLRFGLREIECGGGGEALDLGIGLSPLGQPNDPLFYSPPQWPDQDQHKAYLVNMIATSTPGDIKSTRIKQELKSV